jgi:hypothetical protein
MAGRDRRAGRGRLAVLVPLASCAVFDPARPIEIVPADDATESDVAALAAAGECWGLGFGTQFEVTRDPTSEQAVFVQYDNLVCISAAGVFTPGVPARIDVCPPGLYQGPDDDFGIFGSRLAVTYFNTVSHELGHAAGIRAEGSGEYSVMGRNKGAWEAEKLVTALPAFSDEDYALFRDAHPEFAIVQTCDVWMVGDRISGVRCECR